MKAFRLSIMQSPKTLWGLASQDHIHILFHDTGEGLIMQHHDYDTALGLWDNRIRKADGSYWSLMVDPSNDCPSPCNIAMVVMEIAIIQTHTAFRSCPDDRTMETLINRWSVSGQAGVTKVADFLFSQNDGVSLSIAQF